ncbi:hypothetical protein FOMPIDRAFT_91243 [Fomitopsis schrenkii]|uniref:Uncharacterized protein n=1 Tax=Fomitopsis schrenkii TaxID=2126942 RepID=S8E496_FOMSC|nr:hypothetical protein FOMPIDRAFT_91243 [Fomitopsis schrenkii]
MPLPDSNADTPPPSQTSVTSSPREVRTPLSSSPALTVSSTSNANPMTDKPISPTVRASSRTDSPSQSAAAPPVSAPDEPHKPRSSQSQRDATAQSDLRPLPNSRRNWNVESVPPEPADKARLLANRPWTVRETYLLAFVATLCPLAGPPDEYWPAVCDLYNYMLMFPQLHAWVARTEADEGLDQEDAPRKRHAFWEAFFRELCAHWRGSYDVGPQSTKLQHVADAFLAMCVGKAREEMEVNSPTGSLWNVAGGARDESAGPSGGEQCEWQILGSKGAFIPGKDGWYDAAFPPPPLVYNPSRARPWIDIWRELIRSPMGTDFRMRHSTVELFGRVYELLGPLYLRRTSWECWYRWAVPKTKVSEGKDCTIEHAWNGSIVIRSVSDRTAERHRETESWAVESHRTAASRGQSAVVNATSGASAQNELNSGRTESAAAAVEDRHEGSHGEEEEVNNESDKGRAA